MPAKQNEKKKLKQIKFYLTMEQYERLKSIADSQGLTVPSLVKQLVLEFIGEVNYGDLIARIRDLETKYEQLAKEIGRMEKDLAIVLKRYREYE